MVSGVTTWSITQNGRYEPWELQVARGQITGHSVVTIFGYQASVGIGTPIPVWEVASAYTYPVAATTMLLYSSSASDTNINVTINGLDANFNPISEQLTLTNGVTGVTTAKSYLRIQSMIANDNTFADPVGNLTLGNAGKTIVYARIIAGINRTQMGIYTIPAGYTFYISRITAFTNEAGSGNNYANFQVYNKNNITGQTFTVLQAPFLGVYNIQRTYPFVYTEKTDVQWQVSVGTGTSPVGTQVEGILIANDGAL